MTMELFGDGISLTTEELLLNLAGLNLFVLIMLIFFGWLFINKIYKNQKKIVERLDFMENQKNGSAYKIANEVRASVNKLLKSLKE